MSRETHVRFCERVGLRCPARLTQILLAPPARPVFAPLSRAPSSDYAVWQPRWIIEKFMAFELPEDLQKEAGRNLTLEAKRKILGGNAARLYSINVEPDAAKLPE